MLERKEIKYEVKDVLDWVLENDTTTNKSNTKKLFDGDMIKVSSLRYQTFIHHGIECECGVKGLYFYKERHQAKSAKKYKSGVPWHFNLYGIDKDSKEVLITRDHILARSRGGKDTINNMNTMCATCNCNKGSLTTEEWASKKSGETVKEDTLPKYITVERKVYYRLLKTCEDDSRTRNYLLGQIKELKERLGEC